MKSERGCSPTSFGKGRVILFFYLILSSALMTQKVKSWKGPSRVFPASHFLFFQILFLFIFGCAGSSLLCGLFSCGKWRILSGFGARASCFGGFSARSMGSRAQAQKLWCVALTTPWLVGSSQIRLRTHFSCISRWILYLCGSSHFTGGLWTFRNVLKSTKAFPVVLCPVGASQVALVVKNPPTNAGDIRDLNSIPG